MQIQLNHIVEFGCVGGFVWFAWLMTSVTQFVLNNIDVSRMATDKIDHKKTLCNDIISHLWHFRCEYLSRLCIISIGLFLANPATKSDILIRKYVWWLNFTHHNSVFSGFFRCFMFKIRVALELYGLEKNKKKKRKKIVMICINCKLIQLNSEWTEEQNKNQNFQSRNCFVDQLKPVFE